MNITLIYNKSSIHIKTVYDHVMSFKKYSKHKINLIDYNDFDSIYKIKADTIILHYSVIHTIVVSLIKFIDIIKLKEDTTKEAFKNLINNKELKTSCFYHLTNFLLSYNGNKFAFIQDEYYDTNLIKMFLETININTVFTCIPKEHISKIYDNLNNTGFVHNLTGYVPEYNLDRIPIKDRECDVFYRGRELHYWYGDLGQDKMNIGKYMKKHCNEYNLISNIDWNGENCIYGDNWFKVLGNSKVTLATESGTTIFDIDNTIVRDINILLDENPTRSHQNGYSKTPKFSYKQIKKMVNLERNLVPNMGQISPKMFEAIMLGTVLVMYEGHYYPGFLIPDVHYIVLKKDYSNINEVINKIKDDNFLQKMSDRAYNDIIRSGLYSYKQFIKMFDKEVGSPYIYKPDYIGNKNLEFYPITKCINKNLLLDSVKSICKLSSSYDAIIMLTVSNWLTEPISNRYHYASRFSKELPVYFIQPYGYDNDFYKEILNINPNIHLIKYSNLDCHKKTSLKYFKKLMERHKIINPLFWSYTDLYEEIINLYPNSYKVYHAAENYFCDSNLLFNTEPYKIWKEALKKRIKNSNLIISVNDSVNDSYIQKLNLDKDTTFVSENGCDANFYIDLKKELNLIETNRKIVIYQGGINLRLDFNLLKNLIKKLPDWTFYFCGIEDDTIEDWKEIKENKRVTYFGGLEIRELGEIIMKSTVGIIPYNQDEIIYKSFPLKSFEYISCGLPVVTIPIKSLEDKNKNNNVFQFAKNADAFAIEIEKAYYTRYDKKMLELRKKVSFENSYDNRFKQVKNILLYSTK